MTTKSLLSMEVGGPRIDSTCFFDIPSLTSSTFAFVIRLPAWHPLNPRRRTSSGAATNRENALTRDATKWTGRRFIKSPVAFTHDEVQTPQNRDQVADHAAGQKL